MSESEIRSDSPAIVEQLVGRASEFGLSAGIELVGARGHQFAVAAATVVELLAKAVLCTVHPSTIIDRDFDSLLRVLGKDQYVRHQDRALKTISGRDALDRCKQIVPKLGIHLEALLRLVELRNGTLHLGDGESNVPRDVVVGFLGFIEAVSQPLGISTEGILGDYAEFFTKLRVSTLTDNQRRVAQKVFAAKQLFNVRFANVRRSDLPRLTPYVRPSCSVSIDRATSHECPACGQDGAVACAMEKIREGGTYFVDLYPLHFICPFCDLELEDEEVRLAGLPDVIHDNPEPVDDLDQ